MVVTLEARKKVLENIEGDSNVFRFNFFPPYNLRSTNSSSIEIVRIRESLEDKNLGNIETLFAENISRKYSLDLREDLRFCITVRNDNDFNEAFRNLNMAEEEFVGELGSLQEYLDSRLN